MCGQARLCAVKDCEKRSTSCQIDCCHRDGCNTATKRAADMTNTLLGGVLKGRHKHKDKSSAVTNVIHQNHGVTAEKI